MRNQDSTLKELQQKVKELRALQEINKAISSTLDLDKLLNLILDKALELTRASDGHVQLVEGDYLVIKADRGSTEEKVRRRVEIGKEGVTGWVAKEKKPALVSDVDKDPRYLRYIPGMRSELAVAMLEGDELIGVLNVESPILNAFDGDDQRLLEALASQAVIAIKNARAYQKLEDITEQLQRAQSRLENFTRGAAHQLRNPLQSISYILGDLKRKLLSDSQFEGKESLETMYQDLRLEYGKMVRVVEGMLQYGTIDRMRLSKVQVRETCEELLDRYQERLSGRIIQNEILPSFCVFADDKKIEQVFDIIIKNAIEATSDGDKIVLKAYRNANEGFDVIEFFNSGSLVPKELESKLCKEIIDSTKKERGGVGMGLLIASEIVLLHQGELEPPKNVSLEGLKGVGVIVRLPLRTLAEKRL